MQRRSRSSRRRRDPTPERLRKAKNLEILQGFAGNAPGSKPVTLHFRLPYRADARRRGRARGDLRDLVVTCIGYGGADFPQGEGVFPVGWARRGPTGTIPTNRADSHAVAQQVHRLAQGARSQERRPIRCRSPVDAAGWHRIDKAEIAAGAARAGRA